jgi:hypothetical protein
LGDHQKHAKESQVIWALLAEGLGSARLEAHRLRHLATRALKLIEASPEKDHLYQVAGDIIQIAPKRIEDLERHLDRLSYVLSQMGKEHLRERLSLDDRALIDDSLHKTVAFPAAVTGARAERVAFRYLERMADLTPPLGYPGGLCQITSRIYEEIRNPKLLAELVEDVERGFKLDNSEAAKIYNVESERGAGIFTKMAITSHAQYRMDQRGVTVTELRMALQSWSDAYLRGKQFINQPVKKQKLVQLKLDATVWQREIARGGKILWTDPRVDLSVVFSPRKQTAGIITCYWNGQSDPKPVGTGDTCPVPR